MNDGKPKQAYRQKAFFCDAGFSVLPDKKEFRNVEAKLLSYVSSGLPAVAKRGHRDYSTHFEETAIMTMRRSRRDFLRDAAMTSAGLWAVDSANAAWAQSKSPNEKINFACIGVGGKGDSDSGNAGNFGNIVAICDVDEDTLNRKGEQFPGAKKYTDWRKMLDEMHKQIDGVTVSVPDHSHGPAASAAMHLGKAVYCQKPLAHSIYEVRALSELARHKKVATQMGNQGTADNSMRANAYKVRAGALGVVKEVHVWTDRPIWPQGLKTRRT